VVFLLTLPILFSSAAPASPDPPIREAAAEILNARLPGDDLVVISAKDSGPGTLRQAIADATSASPDGSVIVFSSRMNRKTITLTSGQLDLTNTNGQVTVTGTSLPQYSTHPADLPGGVIVSGNNASRVLATAANTDIYL